MRPSPVVRRRAGAVALAAAAVALVWLLLSGGGDSQDESDLAADQTTTPESLEGDSTTPAGEASEEELIEGVMLVGFEGADPAGIVGDLKDHAYGGVLIQTSNWRGRGPGTKLVGAIREQGDALVATSQEGGVYRALPDLPPEQREIEIGDRGKPKLAEAWGEDAAKALAEVGIDLNLAPVADVATLDSPIADRAFSDDPGVAAEMTAAALDGCRKGGVDCAVAHFPGLGAGSQDTDAGPSSIGLDPATLESRDLVPFRAAFDAGVPAVVVSHGLYAAYDPVTPASLSETITTGLLREDLGYEGVAISDDIGAGAIGAVSDPGPAAVAALNAGIDLVQVADPADVAPVRRALGAALDDGMLSKERLQEAVSRVRALQKNDGGAA